MNPRQFQIETERRLQAIDPTLIAENKLTSDSILSLLDEAIDKFVKTRYSGINYKQLGFELSLKRIDDLRTLVTEKAYTVTEINNTGANYYTVKIPDNYLFLLGDRAGIQPVDNAVNECWGKDADNNYIVKSCDTLESTIETIDKLLLNSLSEHRLKYCFAKPIKLVTGNVIGLYTDGKYKVSLYKILYLRKPSKLDLTTALVEYTDLPEHTHIEIVKLAVLIYCGTKAIQNYNSFSNEVNNME